jgi:hypothetical protein
MCCPYPLLRRPLICHSSACWWCSIAQCIAQCTQNVNTGGALAASKSAKAMLGPPDTALLHVCGPPRPGVANRPSSCACYVGPGHGQSGERRRGSRTATCDLSADAPHQATACNSHGTAAAMRAAAESPIPSRPPDARELFPTRVSVAPSGLSPLPALSTLRGGSRCGVRVRRASCGASPIAPGASATPRSLPRSSTRAWDKFRSVSWVSPAAQTPLETQIKSRALQTAF